ncbi:MAG: hypothetical protein ACLQFI_14000 [Methylocella sp.]
MFKTEDMEQAIFRALEERIVRAADATRGRAAVVAAEIAERIGEEIGKSTITQAEAEEYGRRYTQEAFTPLRSITSLRSPRPSGIISTSTRTRSGRRSPRSWRLLQTNLSRSDSGMTAKTGGLARTKPAIFGVPSLETARAIDDSDKGPGLQAAHYRLSARMRR